MSAATGGAGTATGGAATGGPNTYMIMGHGIESLIEFEKRPILKPGYTLVTFTECGRVTDYDTVIPFLQEFTNPSKASALQNPIRPANPKYRIYGPGDQIPVLKVSLFLNMEEHTDGFDFMKSGVYRLGDTMLDDWILTQSPSSITAPYEQERYSIKIPITRAGKKVSKETIMDNIIPTYIKSQILTPDIIKTALATQPAEIYYDNLIAMKIWEVPLEKILDTLGPGVYYWPVCRSFTDYYDIATYAKAMNEIMGGTTFSERYKNYSHENFDLTPDKRTNVLRMLQEDMANPAIVNWAKTGELKTATNEFTETKKKDIVRLIRYFSGQQQNRLSTSRSRASSSGSTVVVEPNSNGNMGGGARRRRQRKTRRRKRDAKRRVTRRH